MKKKLTLILSVFVILALAVSMFVISGAEENDGNYLDVSEGEGVVFDGLSLYKADEDNCMTEIPVTYEAWVKAPAGYNKEQGVIFGNYEGNEETGVRFRGFSYGRAYLYFNPVDGAGCHFYFSGTNLSNSQWTHVAIVDDVANGEVRCYINGELSATVQMTDAQKIVSRDFSMRPMCIGGDYLPATAPFVGNIRSVAIYSDVRTENEIKADMEYIKLDEENLISAYNLNGKQGAKVIEDATGRYDMTNNRATSDWVEPEQMPELEEYSYSMAIVGDTQILSGYYPELYHSYFDWLLANKDEHKIEQVLNLGDITNFNYDWEWDNIRNEWFRLNGELDYTLVRGDHDVLSDKLSDNGDDTTKYDRWFNVSEYTDRFNNSEDADYYQGANGSMTNSYRALDIKGNKYLIVTVDKYPSEDVMAWIDAAIRKYPGRRVIMTMHCFLEENGSYMEESNNKIIGDDFWNRVKGYENLEMIICGHQYAWGVTWVKDKGTEGNIVNQLCINPQGPDFDQAGPTGMIAMLYFSEDGTDVQVRYYSPILDKYYVGNYNDIVNGYELETSAFTMKTDDISVATQIKKADLISYEKADSANTSFGVVANANGESASVKVSYSADGKLDNGKVTLFYDSKLLSAPEVVFASESATKNVQIYDGVVIVNWNGFNKTANEGELFTVNFASSVTEATPTTVELRVDELNYTENEVNYVYEEVSNTGCVMSATQVPTVTYSEGDDWEAEFEYALEIAKYSDVKFVMAADFVAAANVTLGSEAFIPSHKVMVTSADTSNRVTLKTGGFNLVFWGQIEFSNLKMDGTGSTSANTYFFPNGASVVVGTNVNCGSSRANLAGANITLNSGVWYTVSAINDYSVIEGYLDQTVKDDGKKSILINDPKITLQGTARTINLYGGAATDAGKSNSKDGTIFVLGKSTVKILDSARVETLATASGYGGYSTHDGELYVNTTNTVKRLAAAVGPVGVNVSNHTYYPNFSLIVDNVTMNEEYGFVGIWARSDKDNTNSHANISITINGGTFAKDSYGGVFASGADYTRFYGTNTLVINGGNFTKVFGGSFLNGVSSAPSTSTTKITDHGATTYFTINGGEYSKDIYAGSDFRLANCHHSGDTFFTINNGTFTKYVWGGSYFAYSTTLTGATHSGDSKTVVNGGTITAQIAGGSEFGGDAATHSGNTTLELKGGTFTGTGNIYGGAAVYGYNSRLTGDSTFNIYGGVELKGNVYGGSNLQKWGANGFPTTTTSSTGVLASGDVYFNVYNYDKDGNAAVAKFDTTKIFVAGSRLHVHYGEMTGNVYYDIKGATLPKDASALNITDWDAKMTGNITGTLENVTLTDNFYGGGIMSGSRSIQTGNSTLILKNVNVNGIVTGGSKLIEYRQNNSLNSTLNFESGTVNGKLVGGSYYTVPNVSVKGNSKLVFGTDNTTPTAKVGSAIIGGSLAADSAITSAGTTAEWGMYGSSDLVINKGTAESGAYVVGGSYVSTSGTPATTVDWEKYPVVGGVAGETNKNHTKLTINNGTVYGPKVYAGSYLANGGQDHGTVELEINGGTLNLSATGITNYGSETTFAVSPVTYYPTNTKDISCNYVLTINGGSNKIVTSPTRIGICAGLYGYAGDVTGNTTLNLNAGTRAGSNFNNTVGFVVAGFYNFSGVMTGDTVFNVGNMPKSSYDLYCISVATFGCHGVNNVSDVEGDGIKHGFRQIGDAYLNVTGGTVARPLYSGYRSNIDGNVYVNISNGNINHNVYGGAGNAGASTYSSVTGDVIWNISGGTFLESAGVYGGSIAASGYSLATEYNVIGGNIYMEISGGTFNGILSLGGLNGVKSDSKASIKFVGNDFVIASTAKVLGHGDGTKDFSVADDANYILDLMHTDKSVNSTKFGQIVDFADGSEVTLSNTNVENGTVLADFMKGQTVTIDGNTFKYDDAVYFNDYTEYDNGFDFYTNSFGYEQKIETIDVINKVIVGVGEDRSAEITLNNTSRDTGIHGHVLGTSLTLSDSIAVNMGVKDTLFTAYSNIRVKAIFNGEAKEYDAPTRDALYSYENIGPHMMNDAVYFMIYATNADGEEVSSGILNQTIKKFCTNKLATSEEVFKKVCMDLLNYGAAAQVYANYQTDTPANTGVDAYKQYATAEMTPVSNKSKIEKIENATVALQAPNLYLDKNVEIRYTYKPTEEKLEELVAKVVLGNGTEFTLDIVNNADNFIVYEEGGFVLRINQLNPSQMRETVTVSFWKGETQVSHAVTYSIESYVASKLSQTSALKDMIVEMMKYGDAVKAWQDAANA